MAKRRKTGRKKRKTTFDPYKTKKRKYTKRKTKKVATRTHTVYTTHTKLVYVGPAQIARRIGDSTGKEYIFTRDGDKLVAVRVNDKDLPALLKEKGQGCWRREPQALFITEFDWEEHCD